jgi:hypothetical protein
VYQPSATDASAMPWWAGAQSVLLPPPVLRQIRAELTAAAHSAESDASVGASSSSSFGSAAANAVGAGSNDDSDDASTRGTGGAAITRALCLNVRGLDGYAHAEFSALSTHPAAMGTMGTTTTAVDHQAQSSNASQSAADQQAGRAGKKAKHQHQLPAGREKSSANSGLDGASGSENIALTAVGSDASDVVFGTATVAAILHNLRALGVNDARVLSSAASQSGEFGADDDKACWTTIDIASLGAQIDVSTARRRHRIGGAAGVSSASTPSAPLAAASMPAPAPVAVTRVRIDDLENDRAHAIVQRAVTAAVR